MAYYPGEEEYDQSLPERDMEDYMPDVALPSQAQAVAIDQQLSQRLPGPGFAVPVASPGGRMGEASREYYSGRPGLFVQGGPSVPAGMIEVNGQLERSQAAPQPVPWWITQADEYKDRHRQEDFLRTLIDRAGPMGAQAVGRAQQLQARLQLDSDLKSGVPLRDALMKNAANLYGNAPAAMTRLATSRPPAQPITGVTEFTGKSGRQYYVDPANGGIKPLNPLKAPNEDASVAQKLGYWSHRLNNLQKQITDAFQAGNTAELTKARADEASALGEVDALLKRQQAKDKPNPASAAPTKPTQTQTSPRVTLANRLASEHPDWSKEQIIAEAKKQLK